MSTPNQPPVLLHFAAAQVTAGSFAEADLNLRLAADRLRIHHNTAHYRLRRIADLLELLVALAIRDGAGEGGDRQ